MATIFGHNTPDTISGTTGGDLIFGWDSANIAPNQGPDSDADNLAGGTNGAFWAQTGVAGDQRAEESLNQRRQEVNAPCRTP